MSKPDPVPAEAPRPLLERLPGGAWAFRGRLFDDFRGASFETFDRAEMPVEDEWMQENVIRTYEAGCARGLHYQLPPYGQAKLVTVIRGQAQFFWAPLDGNGRTHALILGERSVSLYTPADCAHGFLALENDTIFQMKMSAPVKPDYRGAVDIRSADRWTPFAVPLREELLSERDRSAPQWAARRTGLL